MNVISSHYAIQRFAHDRWQPPFQRHDQLSKAISALVDLRSSSRTDPAHWRLVTVITMYEPVDPEA